MNIPENFDRWMFDYLEGNLTPAETNEFEQFLELNPDFEADADAWQQAVVEDESIQYPNIQNLQRNRKVAGTWYGWSAAATLLVLIIGGGYYLISTPLSDAQNAREFVITNALIDHTIETTNHSLINPHSQSNGGQLSLQNQSTNPTSTAGSRIRNVANSFTGNALSNENQNANLNLVTENQGFDGESDREGDLLIAMRITQELAKYQGDGFAGQYQNNPTESNAEFNLTKKNHTNFNSFGSVTKRIYRKLEKMMGYPVGIVNLRDQVLLMPENSLVSSNPGFTGAMLKPRVEMTYRNQWLGSTEFVQKSQFSFDDYVESIRGGFGFSLNSAIYGNGGFADHSIDFRYSPKIVIAPKVVFEPGINVSLGMLSANNSKLGVDQHVELERGLLLNTNFESLTTQTTNLFYKDYGLGFVLNMDKFYVGASADNLNRHYANLYRSEGEVEPMRTPVLMNAIAGFDYVSKTRPLSLSPFIAARKFGDFAEAWGGFTMRLNYLTIGASYSTQQNYAASIGLKFEKFKLTYQYDVTQSLYTLEQMGSHSIGIRFNGGDKKYITNRR